MKLTINKGELQTGLSRLQGIVEKRNSMPILANVLMSASNKGKEGEQLQLAATDLEVGIQSSHEAKVTTAGGVTVSAKKLFEIVRELPDEDIHLEATANGYLNIKCARSNFTLAGTSTEEYPTLPNFTPGKTASVEAAVLSLMIERTMYAASVDETRYNLNGVYLEVLDQPGRIRMVATDGHRLATVDRTLSEDPLGLENGVIIPRKGLGELKKLVDEDDADQIDLAFEGNNGLARKGKVTLVMRLIEGEFPNYSQVLPKKIERNVVIPGEDLIRALRRVALLSSERSKAVKLEFTDGRLTISSSNPDLGDAREELDIDFAGDEITIGFNAKYLLDALSTLKAKEVRFGLQNELAPAQFVPTDDDDTLAVVMPMRV
ncbi:MAG TPA: DNA polymerase III subunit beta [Myxococcales bacterium]|nr:DNA polymerase III subunit beta [Myxococcales bacterium]HIM02405.1 DNA polymerase III subunit beta [Myxococcales bacterium]